MRTIDKPVGILYGQDSRVNPLFTILQSRGIPVTQLDPRAHTYDPSVRQIPFSLLLNDLSDTSNDNKYSLYSHSLSYIRHLEDTNPGFAQSRLINGSRATEILNSRSRQLTVFSSLGLPFPRTFVISSVDQLFAVTDELRFPLILKTDSTSENSPAVYVHSLIDLMEVVASEKVVLNGNSTILVQEYIRPKGKHLVRVETLNGQVTEALKLHVTLDESVSSFVIVSAEGYILQPEIARRIEKIVRAAHVEAGSVEYLTDPVTNAINFIGIRPHTYEISTEAGNHALETAERIARYVELRLLKVREIELAL